MFTVHLANSIEDNSQSIFFFCSLGLDYLYLVSYSSAISLGCVLVARRLANRATRLSSLGVVLSWAQPAAALLDVTENYALIRVLFGAEEDLWPTLAWWCAVPKFAIVASGILYLLIGGILLLMARPLDREKDVSLQCVGTTFHCSPLPLLEKLSTIATVSALFLLFPMQS